MSYTDSTTGQTIEGKAYVLKSTEGEEIVDPARLFQGQEQDGTVAGLQERVARLEAELGLGHEPAEQAVEES